MPDLSLPANRSLLSAWSDGSMLSVGSAGSILSIGSVGSILSIGSAGSVLSIGSAGALLSRFSILSVGGNRDFLAYRIGPGVATAAAIAAFLVPDRS